MGFNFLLYYLLLISQFLVKFLFLFNELPYLSYLTQIWQTFLLWFLWGLSFFPLPIEIFTPLLGFLLSLNQTTLHNRNTTIQKRKLLINWYLPLKYWESEWSVSRKDLPKILCEISEKFQNTKTKSQCQLPLFMRNTNGDDIPLSPCEGRDSTYITLAWLSVPSDEGFEEIRRIFTRIMKKYQARPHWGKIFDWDQKYLSSIYKNFEKFSNALKEYDPNGVFSNTFREILFDSSLKESQCN